MGTFPREILGNEWVVSEQILMFAHRFLSSPHGKHCNSLEGNIYPIENWTFALIGPKPPYYSPDLRRAIKYAKSATVKNGGQQSEAGA